MAKRQYLEFVSSGIETNSAMEASKKSSMYDLRTGKPFSIPEEDQYGRCRPVTDFEKLNRIGEGTYGIVYRARDTVSGIICFTLAHKSYRVHTYDYECTMNYFELLLSTYDYDHDCAFDLLMVKIRHVFEIL